MYKLAVFTLTVLISNIFAQSPPSSSPAPGCSGAGSSSGDSPVSCVQTIFDLCTDYYGVYNDYAEGYGNEADGGFYGTAFTNTYIMMFHGNLMRARDECDLILQFEQMRVLVKSYNGGSGQSTWGY